MPRSIRTRLVAAQFLYILLAVLASGLAAYLILGDALIASRLADLGNQARHLADRLADRLAESDRDFRDMAGAEAIEVYARKSQHPVLLKHFQDRSALFPCLRYISPTGEELVCLIRGRVVADAPGAAEDPLFAAAAASPGVPIRVVRPEIPDGAAIRYALARIDYFDRPLGTVMAEAALQPFCAQVLKEPPGGPGLNLLLDRGGQVLCPPGGETGFRPLLPDGSGADRVRSLLRDAVPGVAPAELMGMEGFAAVAPLTDGLSILRFLPAKALTGDILTLQLVLAGLAAALAALVGLAASRTARSLAAPLADLAQAAGRIARGDLTVQAPTQAPGEIGELAAAFNGMVRELAASAEQLARAKNQAEAANRAKSRFLANMSHEFRTPMNIVLGVLEVVRQAEPDPRMARLIDQAMEAGRDNVEMIGTLLDVAQLDSGEAAAGSLPFHPAEAVRKAVERHRPAAEAKGLSLRVDVSPDAPRLFLGDPETFGRIVGALVGNAVKFSEAGEVSVEVFVSRYRPGPDRATLIVCVSDQGPGIEEGREAALFQAFALGDDSTTRRHGGAGLGLGLTLRLVRLLGGGVAVDSSQGRGSAFYVSLPLRLPQEDRG